jgi:nucleoside-diphosphate-sugar epimerase
LTIKKVLITGADGFIGSHLVEALVRQGYETRAFVQYNSLNSWGWLDGLPNDVFGTFDVVSGDISHPTLVFQPYIYRGKLDLNFLCFNLILHHSIVRNSQI